MSHMERRPRCDILKFEELNFHDKYKIFSKTKWKIYKKLLENNPEMSELSSLAVYRYLEILINDQHYNPKASIFYDPYTRVKIGYDLFANITAAYINEHLSDFVKESKK